MFLSKTSALNCSLKKEKPPSEDIENLPLVPEVTSMMLMLPSMLSILLWVKVWVKLLVTRKLIKLWEIFSLFPPLLSTTWRLVLMVKSSPLTSRLRLRNTLTTFWRNTKRTPKLLRLLRKSREPSTKLFTITKKTLLPFTVVFWLSSKPEVSALYLLLLNPRKLLKSKPRLFLLLLFKISQLKSSLLPISLKTSMLN